MTQHNYTHVIDMSNSSAFHSGFYDDLDKVVYLTFRDGATVSREVPDGTTPEDVSEVQSWGSLWHQNIKNFPRGPVVEPGDEFVYREAPAAAQDNGVTEVSDDVWDTFKDALVERVIEYGEEWWIEDYEEELREALDIATRSLPQAEPTEVENEDADLAEATRNSEGTFLGIGFLDVPAEVEQRLTSALGFFNEFVRGEFGEEVKGLVQRYDVKQMRDFMRGLR